MGFATQVERDENGNWQGLDGPLHPDDGAELDQIEPLYRRAQLEHVNGMLDQLMSQPAPPRPQNFADFMEALDGSKAHIKKIRLVTAIRDGLQSMGGK